MSVIEIDGNCPADVGAELEDVLWSSLHPDERPASMEHFRKALLGYTEAPTLPISLRRPRPEPVSDILAEPPESTLAWSAAVLFLISLLATLAR